MYSFDAGVVKSYNYLETYISTSEAWNLPKKIIYEKQKTYARMYLL